MLSKYPTAGIDFAYVPVRNRVLKAHLALGFQALGELPLYVRPFRSLALARHYLKGAWGRRLASPLLCLGDAALRFPWHRASSAITVESVREFDEPLADALNGVCGELGTHAERSAAVLRWRFADAPGRRYEAFVARQADRPLGYVVTRAMPMAEFAALAVVDLVFPPQRPDVGASLLHAVHRAALEYKVDLAACMLNPHSPLLRVLRRFGYLRAPEGFTLIAHVPPQSALCLDKEFFHRWHLTWFEHDYV